MAGHPHIDRWSLLMHCHIADRIAAGDVEPVRIAKLNLERWRNMHGGLQRAQAEWIDLLALPTEQLIALLRDEGEEATRLRSSSPFAGVLDNRTRMDLFHEARAA